MKKINFKLSLLVLLPVLISAGACFAQTSPGDYDKLKKDYETVLADRDNLLLQFKSLGDYKSKYMQAQESAKKASEELAAIFDRLMKKAEAEASGGGASPFAEITDDDIDNLFSE